MTPNPTRPMGPSRIYSSGPGYFLEILGHAGSARRSKIIYVYSWSGLNKALRCRDSLSAQTDVVVLKFHRPGGGYRMFHASPNRPADFREA